MFLFCFVRFVDWFSFFSFSNTLARAAALAYDFNLLGVPRAVVANQFEAALLGAARPAAVRSAVAAAHRIAHRFRRSASVFHIIIAILFFTTGGRCKKTNKKKNKKKKSWIYTIQLSHTFKRCEWYWIIVYLNRTVFLPIRAGTCTCSSCRPSSKRIVLCDSGGPRTDRTTTAHFLSMYSTVKE